MHTGIRLFSLALLFGIICNTLGLSTQLTAQVTVSGELMENPFFIGNNYENWSFGGKWRTDGANDRLVFDVDAANSGFPAAVGTGKTLTSETAITGNASFTTLSNAYLTTVTFNSPFLDRAAELNAGSNADYNLFFELDIITVSGTYRAKSTSINNPWTQTPGSISPTFTWETGSFLGDPADATDDGIPINQITSVQYKAVMQVVAANDNGTGTVFVLLDNLSLTYNVELRLPDLTISGSEGWRMLSTPSSNSSYHDLIGNLWTQGITTGADVPSGDANVQEYVGGTFIALNDLTTTMTAGKGFITYVYSDDDKDGNAEGFPKTLSLDSGTANTSTVVPTLNSGAEAWTLVGNPFLKAIDWDNIAKTDLSGTVYVYDHSYSTPSSPDTLATGSSGSYRVWNGATGSLTNGLIAPYQGFWVQNASSVTSPSLTIELADTASGGVFYKQSQTPTIELQASKGYLKNSAYFSFSSNGLLEKDNYDGFELMPLDLNDNISLSSIVEGSRLDVNNLPLDFEGELLIPIQLDLYRANEEQNVWETTSGEVTLTWPKLASIPDSWELELVDFHNGTVSNLSISDSYTTFINPQRQKLVPNSVTSVLTPPAITKVKQDGSTRFALRVRTGNTVGTEPNSEPQSVALPQNYPNPFNPSTTIKYSVEKVGRVTISVYSVDGRLISELVNEVKNAGEYEITWNAASQASGIYYYQFRSGGNVMTKQMSLIK